MFGKQKKEVTTYGIVGLGRFGFALTEELAEADAEIMVLDKDEDKIRKIREFTENALVVKSLDKKTLAETGIQNCDVAVVCIGEQIATSILTTLNLVSLGIPKVVSKANSAEHGEILAKLAPKWCIRNGIWPYAWPTVWRPDAFWIPSSSANALLSQKSSFLTSWPERPWWMQICAPVSA